MRHRSLPALLAATLVLATVLPHFLDLGYSLTDSEMIVIVSFLALAGFLAGWATHVHRRVYCGLVAFLGYWIVDVYFASSPWMSGVAALAGVAIYAALQSRISSNVRPMLFAFAVFWIGSNALALPREILEPPLTFAGGDRTARNSELPPIIHFIMDEQMSPEAIPGIVPEGHAAGEIVKGYVRRGFDIHNHVRSRSHETRISIGNLLSLKDDSDNFREASSGFSYSVKDNKYFELLRRKGYFITAVQTDFLEFCVRADGVDCHTYSRGTSAQAISGSGSDFFTRLRLALLEFHNNLAGRQSSGGVFAYRYASKALRAIGLPLDSGGYYSRPVAMVDVLSEITRTLGGIENGHAYVFHLLLPHSPYVLDENCRFKRPETWARHLGENLPDMPLEDIYAAYWEQAVCTGSLLNGVIDKVTASVNGRGAIFIIHGDHGSRITLDDKNARNDADVLETFFAVKYRDSSGRVIADRAILQSLFASFVADHIGKAN